MPFPTPPPQISAWSFSRWSTYTDCPLKAKLANVDKIFEPANPAMDKGTGVHAIAEAFGSGLIPEHDKRNGDRLVPYTKDIVAASKGKVPMALAKFATQFKALRKVGPLVEQEWAFNAQWNPTSWFGRDAWLRVKMDAHYLKAATLPVIDYKTGKIYPEKAELQMSLYGLAGLLMYPTVKVVLPALWYLDQPLEAGANPAQHEYTRDMLPKLKALWLKRVAPMLNDRNFAPRPGQHCRWCFYRKANKANGGGQCKY